MVDRSGAAVTPAVGRGDQWIVIPRWEGKDGFQHYRDRDPIWIKNYRALLADDAYLTLSFHVRGVLHALWLEYAASNRQLRDSTLTLTRRLGQRVSTRDLISLNHAGFIHFSASAPLAARYQPASPEVERDKERPSSSTTTPRARPSTDRPCTCPVCNLAFKHQRELADHLENVHWLEGESLATHLQKGTP